MRIAWLAAHINHYHRARADAFASRWPGQLTVIQVSNRDALTVLQRGSCAIAQVETLFQNKGLAEIGPAAVRTALLQRLEAIRPCVCCLNGWALPGTAAMLDWAIQRAVPCVLMSESNRHDHTRYWLKEQIKHQFISRCGAALVGGRWSRNYLIDLGMDPSSIFDGYDVVDNEHFGAGANAARLDQFRVRTQLKLPEHYFLACARFEPKKNLHGLIRAYASYSRTAGPSAWRLVIAGDGPSRTKLESLAQSLGLTEQVIFAGLRTYEEMPSLYGLAKAFVHASTTEQWGLVVNEAMAAGLPVLVSKRCGCVAELVREGDNGFTFDPRKPEDIAERMLSVHHDPLLRDRMGRRSRHIIADWGPERFATNLRRAVECALERGPREPTFVSRAVIRAMAAL